MLQALYHLIDKGLGRLPLLSRKGRIDAAINRIEGRDVVDRVRDRDGFKKLDEFSVSSWALNEDGLLHSLFHSMLGQDLQKKLVPGVPP